MIGNLLKGLFGGENKAEKPAKTSSHPAVSYESFDIIPEPQQVSGQWQLRGRIEKDIDGERKSHLFIRADTLPTEEEAVNHMVRKAKMMIDQQGNRVFD
ncbi:hypothetical protein GCM10011316_04060 [Roseibium aquae]|uniref:Transcriptional activator HlyU n=1 Tax=Roseibium aquae TaxID=1323746 RepID=A0A916WW28_9HYPH|nr:HlyU family transcriptional regulator [Roseibium aquae]GGB35120.1 hypothetical protein GCM10011316_04060 [Roseibium aquae]